MRRAVAGLVLGLTMFGVPLSAADTSSRVRFAPGTSSTTLRGTIKGYDSSTYLVGARAGQTMSVQLKSPKRSVYFSVTAQGADQALFMGEIAGDRFSGTIPSSGDYRIQAYQMRNAARRGQAASFSVTINVR